MCLKCGTNGKQITIATPTIVKLGKLKTTTNHDCMSELIDHLITVFESDRTRGSPVAPTNAPTNETEYHLIRSKKDCPVHLAEKLGDGATTLCGKPMKMTWSVVQGAYSEDMCPGCRAKLAPTPKVVS